MPWVSVHLPFYFHLSVTYRYREFFFFLVVSEPVSEKIGTGKGSRNRYRKNLVPEKTIGTGIGKKLIPPPSALEACLPIIVRLSLFQLCSSFIVCPLHSIATVSIRSNCAFVFDHCEWTNHTFWRPANCVIHYICHYFQEVFLGSIKALGRDQSNERNQHRNVHHKCGVSPNYIYL